MKGWLIYLSGAAAGITAWAGTAQAPTTIAAAPADGASVVQTAPAAPASPAGQRGDPPRTYTVLGVGDIMMGSDWPTPIMDDRVTPDGDAAAVMGADLARLFRETEIVFGNFEGTIHTSAEGAKACSNPAVCFTFRSPPFHAAYLRRMGFNLVSNANNHARDFGEGGRQRTWDALTGAGLAVSASDQPGRRIGVHTTRDGTRVALVAFGHNPGLMSVSDLDGVAARVREAQREADMVIVSCHIGAEGARHDRVTRATELFLGENRGNPFAFARTAVDAGADIVFCHGPHVPRAVEVYKGRFIAYSLGNFWTYGRFNLSGPGGMAPIAVLRVAKDGALHAARIVSAQQVRPGGPFPDPDNRAARMIAEVTARDFPEGGLSFAADGTISWPRQPR